MLAAVLVAAALIVVVVRGQWRAAAADKGAAKFRLLAEHVVDMVSTHDATGEFRYVSPVFAGLVGEYPGMLVGKDPQTLAHPDDQGALAGLWRRALAGRGASVSLIWRCQRHTGEYAWLETIARSATGDATAFGAIVCASRDVTERKQIEDALRESEQRFRGALETVRLVAVGVDTQGTITFANDALCALTAWKRSDLIGASWFERLGVSSEEGSSPFTDAMSSGVAPPTYEGELLCRDGSKRTIAWDITVLRSPTGEVQGLASLGADVTERRYDEATMRLLQTITQSISAARDLDSALARTLESLCGATGWSYGEAWLPTGEPPRLELYTTFASPGVDAGPLAAAGTTRTFAPGEGLPGLAWKAKSIEWFQSLAAVPQETSPRVHVAMQCGFQSAMAVALPSDDRIVAVLAFFMTKPPAADGRQTQMMSVIADQVGALIDRRREQKQHEAELNTARERAEAANRAKSDFLSRMSHELRTPLNSVIGFANVMRKNRSGKLTPDELEYLERITQNGKHLLSLVNDVLDIAKVESGRMTVSKSLVNVDQILRDVVAQLQGQPRTDGVELRAELPDNVLPIEADSALLRQVLINLAGNAIRFTHKGSVVLSADVDERGAPQRIRVRDTGIGIPADRLGAIFEPFEQAEDQTHGTYGGTGLGLAISRSICDALGYSLLVESEVGNGSTFSIALPTDQ
ncbi:MAG: PAS domain S-box protein [Gemmatimonadota bacterium]